jgi:hypothetical protein
LLFFFASPKKNQKKRPENDDSRFRVVLWGAVVQGGERQRGNVEHSSASYLCLISTSRYVASNSFLDLKPKLLLSRVGFQKASGKKR